MYKVTTGVTSAGTEGFLDSALPRKSKARQGKKLLQPSASTRTSFAVPKPSPPVMHQDPWERLNTGSIDIPISLHGCMVKQHKGLNLCMMHCPSFVIGGVLKSLGPGNTPM